MKFYFLASILISLNLFAATHSNYEAEVTSVSSPSHFRTEAVYEKVNGVRGKLLAKKYYQNFKLSEIFVDGKSWSGTDKEAEKRFDDFINKTGEVKAETKFYGDMRQEIVGVYVGDVLMDKMAEKIYVDKTNELRELYVDGSSTDAGNKKALVKIDKIFKEAKEVKSIAVDSSFAGCTKSVDQHSIECPDGLYVKKNIVNESARGLLKEKGSTEITPAAMSINSVPK